MKLFVFQEGILERITLHSNPISQWGEGQIYRIQEPSAYTQYCVKLYKSTQITKEKIEKLNYLYQNNSAAQTESSLLWIQGLVYDSQCNFKGILIPYAEGYSVKYLTTFNFPIEHVNSVDLSQYQKFDRKHPDSFVARLKVCYSIAKAITKLHASQQYVHGNIKPENLIFDYTGKVYLADLDNVQIVQNGNKVFSVSAYSPEYLPPSYQHAEIKNIVLEPFVDVFSMTVIFYHILIGIHPFAGNSFKLPYKNVVDIPSAIKERLVHFGEKREYFEQIPPEHGHFSQLPEPLKEFFLKVLGKEDTQKMAINWSNRIYLVLSSINSTKHNENANTKIIRHSEGGKYGFRTAKGKIVIPCKYDYVWGFKKGLAKVKLNGKYGYIDLKGEEIIPCKYEKISNFQEGVAEAKLNCKWVLLNQEGEEITHRKYDSIGIFCENLAIVSLNGKYGYINIKGEEVVPCRYDYIFPFHEGLSQIQFNGKWGYINQKGEEVIPCKYEYADCFIEGLAKVKLNGKYGYINSDGKEIVPCRYDFVQAFSEGLAAVQLNGKWGFVNRKGDKVIPCKYDEVESFNQGLAVVRIAKSWYKIDIQW
ncbi:MAG: WG repeat-containing protein [Bacteroidia bacterium]|nr:WG repeat-containing protein [Bacteroidia bacterium]